MTASNLMNMYLAEELQEYLPDVVIVAIYSLLLSHRQAPHDQPAAFYAMLLHQMIEQSKTTDAPAPFRKL